MELGDRDLDGLWADPSYPLGWVGFIPCSESIGHVPGKVGALPWPTFGGLPRPTAGTLAA